MKEKLLFVHNFWKCQFQVQIIIQEFWQLFPQTAANSIMAACCKGKPKKELVWQAKVTAVRGLRGSSRLPVSAFHWNAWFYMTVSLYMNKLFATLKYCLYMTVMLHRHNYMCIDLRWSHPLSLFMTCTWLCADCPKNTVIYFNFLIFFPFSSRFCGLSGSLISSHSKRSGCETGYRWTTREMLLTKKAHSHMVSKLRVLWRKM